MASLTLAALQWVLVAHVAKSTEVRRPNILFMVADDLGYNDVSFHAPDGNAQIPTPHLDRLAKAGVQLRSYYVQPVCSPTRSTFLTGRHVIHTGIYDPDCGPSNTRAVRPEFTMLPKHLKNLGYETHAVGKWHLGMHTPEFVPTGRGFDTFYGYYGGAEDYFKHSAGGFRDFHDDVGASLKPDITDDGIYSTHLYAKRASEIIKSVGESRRKEAKAAKPFFMYLAWQAIHAPDEHQHDPSRGRASEHPG